MELPVRTSVILAIVGLSATFVLRALHTVVPSVFAPLALARATTALLFVASVLLLVFFNSLRYRLQEVDRSRLAEAARVATAGAGIGALVELRSLLATVGLVQDGRQLVVVAALGELAAALALLWFFVVVHLEARRSLPGTGGAVAGSAVFAGFTLAMLLLHLTGPGMGWLSLASYLPAIALATVALAALAFLLRFFVMLWCNPARLVRG